MVQQPAGGGAAAQRCLNGLYLHGDSGEHGLFQSVELVEAAPGPTLGQAHEDTAHRAHVNTLQRRRAEHKGLMSRGTGFITAERPGISQK